MPRQHSSWPWRWKMIVFKVEGARRNAYDV
jgi:hypothetical protein